MTLKNKFLKIILCIGSVTLVQHAYAPPGNTGKITISFPKEFDANVKIGPSTFIFAASCATIGLCYQGIRKIAEGISSNEPSSATKEGIYLMSGGAVLLTAVILATLGYQKYSEEPPAPSE